MRGKSPNWLLGVLIPTTYILGGEFENENKYGTETDMLCNIGNLYEW